MLSYFECLQCSVVTPIEASPPKCSGCGHSTGVLHLSRPESSNVDNVQMQKPAAVSTEGSISPRRQDEDRLS